MRIDEQQCLSMKTVLTVDQVKMADTDSPAHELRWLSDKTPHWPTPDLLQVTTPNFYCRPVYSLPTVLYHNIFTYSV